MKSLTSGMAVLVLLTFGSPLASAAFAADAERFNDKTQTLLASLTERPMHKAEEKIALRDRRSRIRNLLCGTLDLKVLGPFVLGEHWLKISRGQRKDFIDAFANTMVRHTLIIFEGYTGETFNIIAVVPKRSEPKLIAITVNITRPSGPVLAEVSGQIRDDWGDFKIIDIVGGGVSTALTLREEYREVIEKSDGKVDGLIKKLRQSVASTDLDGDVGAACTPAGPVL